MTICMLGAVMVGGVPVSSARQRRLLAALAIARGGVVSSDRLFDIVWDGDPTGTVNALQTYVSRLRTVLGAEAIVWRPPGYALALPVDEVDAWRFEALVEQARQRPPVEALDVIESALALWHGTAYAEFADAEFAQSEAVRLEELHASAAVARLDALLDIGRADEAVADAVHLIETNPYRESVWERRMRALHAAGRTVEAVRVFREYRTLLAEDTGLEPSAELVALERALLTGPSPVESEAPTTVGVLPAPMTTLVGRGAARDDLVELMAARRVITLVGPGGVGKTRLAVEVAGVHRDRTGWPVSFVELAASGADAITSKVGRALGVAEGGEPLPRLRHLLAARDHLVLLDNCEHVVETVAELVEALVPFCPRLRVLATSRTKLGVAGEHVWTVEPLPVPDAGSVEQLGDLDSFAATRLFLDRAGAACTGLDGGAEPARWVARICTAVDGLPLGIELAAALTSELPLDRISAGLVAAGEPRKPDSGSRHRSLDAVIGWSHELLSPMAQRLLRRLAVFEGGWTVDAAEAVCAGDDLSVHSIPAELAGLVAASLVTFKPATGRYAMLDTIHAFAGARLADADETKGVGDAHLRWCRVLAQTTAPGITGPDAGHHVRRLKIEQPNLRAALRWALADDRHLGQATQLAHDLLDFWLTVEEGGREVTRLLGELLDRPAPATIERVELIRGTGELHYGLGDLEAATAEWERAVALARTLDSPRLLSECLIDLSGETAADAVGMITEARAIAERIGDQQLALKADEGFSLFALRAGRYEEAIAFHEQLLAAVTDEFDRIGTRYRLAKIHQWRGRWQAARDHLLAIEQVAVERDEPEKANWACYKLAQVELAAGELERALRAYQRAAVWGRPADDWPGEQLVFDAVGALLRAETGDMAAASSAARRLAAIPGDISDHPDVCAGWLIIGEILGRAGDLALARRCFGHILPHRAGATPYYRAQSLAAIAGTLAIADHRAVVVELAAVADSIKARHGLVHPAWLTVAIAPTELVMGHSVRPSLTDDEAVALALSIV